MRTGMPRIVPAIAAGAHRRHHLADAGSAIGSQRKRRGVKAGVTLAEDTTPPRLAHPGAESTALLLLWLAGLGGIAVSIATAL